LPKQKSTRLSAVFRLPRFRGPVVASVLAMVACALVGVLLGAYLHEVSAAPAQQFIPIQTTANQPVRTTVRTEVITVIRTTTEPAPKQVAESHPLNQPRHAQAKAGQTTTPQPTPKPVMTPTTTPKPSPGDASHDCRALICVAGD
jgi:outer membrane biosynthesis protein TonB